MTAEELAALTPEELQKRLNDYFNSEEWKKKSEEIAAGSSDEYTKASLAESGASDVAGALSFVKPLDNDALEAWKSQNKSQTTITIAF